jgi:putative transposase
MRKGAMMPSFTFRKGQHVKIGANEYLILQRLPERRWQLQNTATAEYCIFMEHDLFDQFATNTLSFVLKIDDGYPVADKLAEKLERDISAYPRELVAMAQLRLQYLKELDKRQPIAISQRTIEPLIQLVSERIKDLKPPSWRTVCRDYRKWLAAGRDIRAIILRHANRGNRVPRIPVEVRTISDQVIGELYMTPERKRVPEVHLEILRRLDDENKFRPADDKLPLPSQRMIYREIARKAPYELMEARYGKRRAEMVFRVSIAGPETARALQRVLMDHTPADMVVVDDDSMLPLGRPTITTALDEHTRCPTGFYGGFEPPSCLAVMRCLKHAILPKTYISREFPSIRNHWECYGVPELVVVDNPPEFHSTHFERACLQIGADIQYAKVLVPWYKGKLERFQGTMNRDLMHGKPGTTFSNILDRDDYDPGKHAVVLLSTFREILHKWIVDVYLQTPHRGIQDLPSHKWRAETSGLPPPLPPSATALDIVMGMTEQRVVFHYGVELEGLKYNSPELGELRRRAGANLRIDLTFDPGDLGHINVLDPNKGSYICVPALDQAYASRLSLWQHKVIRRYTQRQLDGRTDILALAQAKAEIRALVDRDFHRKSTHGRKRHARFLPESVPNLPAAQDPAETAMREQPPTLADVSKTAGPDFFDDDGVLPVFEADLDLPHLPAIPEDPGRNASALEGA